ncbi:MAG: cold-shock protein [Alphaproteobacteria bacterium]|nr:cold-shock protein [Alphaproteobacteria bacterium]
MDSFGGGGGDGPIQARVKWFNPAKGFGFVTPVDGSADAFLHMSALRPLGVTSVQQGATLTVTVRSGPRGPQVAEVQNVDNSTAEADSGPPMRGPRPDRFGGGPRGPRPDRFGGGDRGDRGDRFGGGPPAPTGPEQQMNGIVKWFNAAKGFGFIVPESGGKDVFIHISTLRRAGIETLGPEQPVKVRVAQGQKGPEATWIEPSGSAPGRRPF